MAAVATVDQFIRHAESGFFGDDEEADYPFVWDGDCYVAAGGGSSRVAGRRIRGLASKRRRTRAWPPIYVYEGPAGGVSFFILTPIGTNCSALEPPCKSRSKGT